MSLFAGVSQVDITPANGLELAGYPHFPRHNTGVHDPLYAACLYLSDGKNKVALVTMDLLFFSRKHVLEVRRRVELATGIPGKNIAISCTHSHSTPWASGRLDMDALLEGAKQDDGLIAELVEKVTSVIISAYRTAFPAEIGFAKEPCGKESGIGGNRRDPANAPSDPFVYTVSVNDLSGKCRCVYMSYNVHPTVLHANNTLCSADYPGYMRDFVREKYPHAVVMFALGCAGDQSTRYFRNGQTFEEAERIGRTLGVAAIAAVEKTMYKNNVRINASSTSFMPNLRSLPSLEYAQKRADEENIEYDRLEKAGAAYIDLQNQNVKRLGAEDVLGYVILREKGMSMEMIDDELPAEIQAIRVGDISFICLPGEAFCNVALTIRTLAGDENAIVLSATNGCLPGYVYTSDEKEHGGYEVDTSMMDENTADLMISAAVHLYLELGKVNEKQG